MLSCEVPAISCSHNKNCMLLEARIAKNGRVIVLRLCVLYVYILTYDVMARWSGFSSIAWDFCLRPWCRTMVDSRRISMLSTHDFADGDAHVSMIVPIIIPS